MAEITAEAVKALRAKTDLPMMDCKKALTEAGGDEAKALEILKGLGLKATLKRADNVTNEGRFCLAVRDDGSQAVLVELMCESAPVAKSEDFQNFGEALTTQLLDGPGAATSEELLAQPNPRNPAQKLSETHTDVVNKIREKIVVGRVWKVAGPVGGYVHHDGKTAVLFSATGDGKKFDVLKDVSMHIAALKPQFALPTEVDPAATAAERARLTEENAKSGKPANIIEKIVEGRMKIFFQEHGVLTEQQFAKDDTKTVGKALQDAGFVAQSFQRLVLGQPA